MTQAQHDELLAQRMDQFELWVKDHAQQHRELFRIFATAAVSVVLAEATTVVGLIIALCR
jgi:hypothetical protein